MIPNPDSAYHSQDEQPYFKIAVTVGGNTDVFDAYGINGWTDAG